jgi:hypothetical protein
LAEALSLLTIIPLAEANGNECAAVGNFFKSFLNSFLESGARKQETKESGTKSQEKDEAEKRR